MPMTSQQCFAARILTEIDQDTLAVKAGVPAEIISLFEEGIAAQDAGSVVALEHALEELGIEFLPEAGGSGVGVRLKFSEAQSRALSTWEDEGGDPAEDKLP